MGMEPFVRYGTEKELVKVAADEVMKAIVEGRDIEIKYAIIEEELDIRKVADQLDQEEDTEAGVSRSIVKGNISIRYSELRSGVCLINSIFQGEVCFSKTCFDQMAHFSVAIFNGYADFHRARFDGGAFFSKASFNEYANFSRFSFDVNADFYGNSFNEDVSFAGANFDSGAFFLDASFSKRADFSGVVFDGEVEFGRGPDPDSV